MHWKRRLLAVALTLSLIAGLLGAAPPGQSQAGVQPPGFGQDLFQVHLAPTVFDPLTTVPTVHHTLDVAEYGATERGLYIVQWKGPVYAEQKLQVMETGAELGDYLPHFAFLSRMTPAERDRVAALPFIRSVVVYKPAFKLAPELLADDGQVVTSFQDRDDVIVQITSFSDSGTLSAAVAAADGTVLAAEEGLLIAEVPLAALPQLAHSHAVSSIAPVPKFELFNDQAAGLLSVPETWSGGLDGRGQIVGVADTGLDTGRTDQLHPDFQGRVTHIFARGRAGDASDTHGHGTHVAGSIIGNGAASGGRIKGMAPAAQLVFQSVADQQGALTGIGSIDGLLRQAYEAGARIHSNSWGDPQANGVYDASSQQLDRFVWNNPDMTVLMAAGNSGAGPSGQGSTQYTTVSTPGTAKNAITIGASENSRPDKGAHADNPRQIATFSSRGWTRDNRVKPDLVAPGTWILSTRSSRAPDSSFWGTYDRNYAYMGGTSMATPIAAGTVALLRQHYVQNLGVQNPSASLLKATLINFATDLGHGLPSRDQGWGRVNLAPLATAAGQKQASWHWDNESTPLATGQSQTYRINVKAGEPLRVTLVWTDYPASANAAKALVNDLDLTVTSPSGKTYYGNDFANRNTADHANNVENVFIAQPEAGTWTITVNGFSVPNGPQRYSLVYSGGSAGGSEPEPPGDHEAPTVTLTAPRQGETVRGNVELAAEAQDNRGVTKVEFLANGAVVGHVTQAPYRFVWNTAKVSNGTYALTARAYDAAGNVGTSAPVRVTVDNAETDPTPNPDPEPTPDPEPGREQRVFTDTVGWFLSRYYVLPVAGPGTVDLHLTWDGNTDLDLYLHDGTGRLLGQAVRSDGRSETLSVNVNQAGRYIVRVQSTYGSTQFRLTASYPGETASPETPPSPPDTPPRDPVPPRDIVRNGVLRAGQRLDVPLQLDNPGPLAAELRWSPAIWGTEPTLLVYHADTGQLLGHAVGSGGQKSVRLDDAPAGQYVVRVQASRSPVAYQLRVTTAN